MKCPFCKKEMIYDAIRNSYKCCKCDLSLDDMVYRTTTTNNLDDLSVVNANNGIEVGGTTAIMLEKDAKIKELEKELALYKKAFEIAKLDGLEMQGYLKEAKEEIENEQKY